MTSACWTLRARCRLIILGILPAGRDATPQAVTTASDHHGGMLGGEPKRDVGGCDRALVAIENVND